MRQPCGVGRIPDGVAVMAALSPRSSSGVFRQVMGWPRNRDSGGPFPRAADHPPGASKRCAVPPDQTRTTWNAMFGSDRGAAQRAQIVAV